MGRTVFLFTLLLLALLVIVINNQIKEDQIQACALYSTDEVEGFPIPLEKCVDIKMHVNCNEHILDSVNRSKVWRNYAMLSCRDSQIRNGLSERYLIEGVD